VGEHYHSLFRLAKGDSPCFYLEAYKGNYCFVDWTIGRLANCDPDKAGCSGSGKPTACEISKTSTECYCEISKSHTMCLYPATDPANPPSQCAKLLSRNIIKRKDKKAIVDKHNELRRKVAKGLESKGVGSEKQPPATDMYKLKWNDELATLAQRWADQCVWKHDKAYGTTDYYSVGQNMAIYMSPVAFTERHYAVHIEGWYGEVKDFTAANVGDFTKASEVADANQVVIGHYTQVVWGKTKEVGCGVAIFENPNHLKSNGGNYPFIEILVCNYGPVGNNLGQAVYTAGETASDCPNQNDDGLCL